MDQPLTSEQIKELLKLDYEKREKSKGYGTAITGLVGVGSGAASHHILRKDNSFFRHLPKVGIAGGLILTGMGLGRVNRIKDKEKAREAKAVTMSARDEFQKIVFGHMEDEEPTDRTKRAREVPENRVGKEVPPKRMRKLFADLKEAVRNSGKVKLSAREQLNIIRFGGEQIAKLVSSIERRATLNPKMAGPADKFLRDVAQNPMHLPTKRIYSNATPQDTASAIDRIAGSKKPSSEYTDQPYHRRALARAIKDWRGGGYENPALMKKWDWETKPPGARFSARDQLDTILFANDPRPRDSQGQFTDANGNMIDPNSIAVAYNKPPQAQPPQQEKPEEEEQDKPKEEESKAKKLISKLNKKESNKKESDMKQNNMSAREELEAIRFGAYTLGDRLVLNAGKRDFVQEELRRGIERPLAKFMPLARTATEKTGSIDYTGLPKSLQSTKPRFRSTIVPSGKRTEYVATPGSRPLVPDPPATRYELPRIKEPVRYSAREELDTIRFGIRPFFKAKYPGGPIKKYTGADAEFMARMQRKDMFPEMLRENAMKRKMAGDDFDARMQVLKDKRSMK